MDKISKDAWSYIYSFCGVGDWQKSHLVRRKWNEWADKLNVVARVFLKAGGHPSEKFKTVEEYKERILGRLRFAHILNTGDTTRLTPQKAFTGISQDDSSVIQDNTLSARSTSLGPAGMPDCFLTGQTGQATSSFVWNGRTNELVGRISGASPCRCAFQVEGNPRFAQLFFNNVGKCHIKLYDPRDDSRIALHKVKGEYSHFPGPSLVYFADAPSGPELVFALQGTAIIRLNATTLEVKGRYTFQEVELRALYVWSKRLYAYVDTGINRCLERNLFPLDLETWSFGQSLIKTNFWPKGIQVDDRNYIVAGRSDGAVKVLGHETDIPVPRSNYRVMGARWGDHDYLIFYRGLREEQPYLQVWRDDDTVTKIDVKELYSRLPVRNATGEVTKYLSKWGNQKEIVPLPDGFALSLGSATQPTIVRALLSATPVTYGRTRLFLIAGLTCLALILLIRRWRNA